MAYARLTVSIAICLVALVGCTSSGSAHAVRRLPTPSRSPEVPAASPSPARTSPAAGRRTGPHGSLRTTGSAAVALTFDDGPSPAWTPKVLALLRRSGIKATFCLVGVEAQRHPRLVQAIVRDGHTLCNHSWDHDMRLGSRQPAYIGKNLARTNAAIRRAVPGATVGYFRQPGGTWTAREASVSRAMGMTPLHWSLDPQDWRKPPASVISRTVIKHTRRGAVVLMHDGGGDRSTTYLALKSILPNLKRRFRLTCL